MPQTIMYPPQKDSPSTFLLGDISPGDLFMTVANAAVLPQDLPYPLTLGFDKKTPTETVMVTAQDLENNQLNVERGTPAYTWLAGTAVARVLTAADFSAVQSNIVDTATVVGDEDGGLVKDLADEVTRATEADEAETERAEAAEEALDTAKVNRTELVQVVTDWIYEPSDTEFAVEITQYNAVDQTTATVTKIFPLITDEQIGLMTPEAYTEIASLRSDVTALQQQGGKFIGVSFATKADLDAYELPSGINIGDFTYVLDDEEHSDATTRWIFDGIGGAPPDATVNGFVFAYIINYDPVGIATSTELGLMKSDSGTTAGKGFVEIDGTVSVVGWDALTNRVTAVENGKATAAIVANNNILIGSGAGPTTYADSLVPISDVMRKSQGRIPQANLVAVISNDTLGWAQPNGFTLTDSRITTNSVLSWAMSPVRQSRVEYIGALKAMSKASFAMVSQTVGSCSFVWDYSVPWTGGGTLPLDIYIWGS